MEIYIRARMRLREFDQWCQSRLARLETIQRETDRLREELASAEREISEVWESDLPRQNKLLLTQVLRVHCRRLEGTLQLLQAEAAAAAPHRLTYRKRWE